MIDIEEDHTVIADLVTLVATIFELLAGLAADLTPLVDQPEIAVTDILLETAVVLTMHSSIGILGVVQQPLDHLGDPQKPRGIRLLDLRQFLFETGGRVINVRCFYNVYHDKSKKSGEQVKI
jgi:hypothetical protein